MHYFPLILATLGFTHLGLPAALLCWLAGRAAFHAIEETDGQLWRHFDRRYTLPWLMKLRHPALLVVLPALLLQWTLAGLAFMGGSALALAGLIGATLGDALFTHIIPFGQESRENPGLSSAWVYLVDGLLLAMFSVPVLSADPLSSILAAAGAASVFLLTPTLLRWLQTNFR